MSDQPTLFDAHFDTPPRLCQKCGEPWSPNHWHVCSGQQGKLEALSMALEDAEFEPFEHARTTDPETSLAAAFSIADASEQKQQVHELHARFPGYGLTDEQCLVIYGHEYQTGARSLESRSSPRKRRSDLTLAGVLVDSGERRALTSGRMGVVWKLAETWRRPAMEQCTNCGINLAKIDAAQVVKEKRVVSPEPQPVLTGRAWCSQQCRDWTQQKEQRRHAV